MIGASVAWHLARRGVRDIVVIDRADDFGGGSAPRATGGFRAQFDNEVEIRLSLLAREKLRAFESEVGVDSGYRPYGYLFLACDDVELDALRQAHVLQQSCGLTEARIVDADEARAISPAIGDPRVIGGAYCPTDGFLRAMKILRGYGEAARRLGVRFEFNVEKTGFAMRGDRIAAVETSAGAIAARIVVNAAGAWSGVPVTPLRRNVVATIETNVLPETTPMTIWSGDWFHFRERDGRVLLLWPDDPPNDAIWFDELMRLTRERVPRVSGIPIDYCWSGFYEMSPDGHALLGRSPTIENLYLATGASGHGVMHSPALGHLLAEMITGETTSFDVSALSPSRFG